MISTCQYYTDCNASVPMRWEWWSLPVNADFLFDLKCVKKVCGRIISYVKRHPLKENECLTFQTDW